MYYSRWYAIANIKGSQWKHLCSRRQHSTTNSCSRLRRASKILHDLTRPCSRVRGCCRTLTRSRSRSFCFYNVLCPCLLMSVDVCWCLLFTGKKPQATEPWTVQQGRAAFHSAAWLCKSLQIQFSRFSCFQLLDWFANAFDTDVTDRIWQLKIGSKIGSKQQNQFCNILHIFRTCWFWGLQGFGHFRGRKMWAMRGVRTTQEIHPPKRASMSGALVIVTKLEGAQG